MSQKERADRVTLEGKACGEGMACLFCWEINPVFMEREFHVLLVSLNIASFFFVCIGLENIVQCKGTKLQFQHHK